MIRRLLVVVAVMSVVAACSSSTEPLAARPKTARATSESTSAARTAATSGTPAGTTSTLKRRTAFEDLAPFLTEARQADARLQHAAALINTGIGDLIVKVDQATVNAVHAAAPDVALSRTVPHALDSEFLHRTLVVYNDLVARHAAMGQFQTSGSYSRAAAQGMLKCLGNGAAPASRFAADLVSLEQYARNRPATAAPAETPETEAEVAVRLELITVRNRCADECGSAVFTDLARLTWTIRPTTTTAGRGLLEEAAFTATPSAQGWVVRFNAC